MTSTAYVCKGANMAATLITAVSRRTSRGGKYVSRPGLASTRPPPVRSRPDQTTISAMSGATFAGLLNSMELRPAAR